MIDNYDNRLRMTHKTRLLIAMSEFVDSIHLCINQWCFNHMDKELSVANEEKEAKQP